MSLPSYQQMQPSKRPLQSAQSRLALLSYLTQKKESAIFKKKSFFWDQEHLYSENLTLRSQIKELTEANLKAKTRILEMQTQIKSKEIRDHEQGYKQSVLRSSSLKSISRKSLIISHQRPEDQGRTKTIRQIVRQLRDEISTLKSENSALKRSLKYTRMNELQSSNAEMEIEMQRLANLTHETKEKYYSLAMEFQALKTAMKRQVEAKKIAIYEKNKIQSDLSRLQQEKQQIQKKREQQERQLRQQIKKAKMNNPEILSTKLKMPFQEGNSIPKLEYSISGLDRLEGDTINFDRLINLESELKSLPKLNSLVSLELPKQPTKNESTPILPQRKHSQKMETHEEENYEEDYEFEAQEEELNKEHKKKQIEKSREENNFVAQENVEEIKSVKNEEESENGQINIKQKQKRTVEETYFQPFQAGEKAQPPAKEHKVKPLPSNQLDEQIIQDYIKEEEREDSVYEDLLQESLKDDST